MSSIISKIKSIIIDNTEECFAVHRASDDYGSHLVLYLVKDAVDIDLLRNNIDNAKIKNRYVIILHDKEFVSFKAKEQNNE